MCLVTYSLPMQENHDEGNDSVCSWSHSVDVYLIPWLVIPNSWCQDLSLQFCLQTSRMGYKPVLLRMWKREGAFYSLVQAAAVAERKIPLALLTGEGRGLPRHCTSLIYVQPKAARTLRSVLRSCFSELCSLQCSHWNGLVALRRKDTSVSSGFADWLHGQKCPLCLWPTVWLWLSDFLV